MTAVLKFAFFLVAIQIVAGVDPPFDFFKLVVQWPHGFCSANPCLRTPDVFTIHGLWPANFSGASVEYCSKKLFQPFIVPSYIDSLDSKWMNLEIREIRIDKPTDQWFWRNQWQKHGLCSEKLYNKKEYFDLGVKLYDRFNITTIFQTNGITRRNFHSFSSMSTAIMSATGFRPDIRCVQGLGSPLRLLEVVICWNPLGTTPINCTQGRTCGNVRTGPGPNIYFP